MFLYFFHRKLFFEQVWWWGRYETLYIYIIQIIILFSVILFSRRHKIRAPAFACCNRALTYRLNSTTIPYRETHKYNDFESQLLYLYIIYVSYERMYIVCVYYVYIVYIYRPSFFSRRRCCRRHKAQFSISPVIM